MGGDCLPLHFPIYSKILVDNHEIVVLGLLHQFLLRLLLLRQANQSGLDRLPEKVPEACTSGEPLQTNSELVWEVEKWWSLTDSVEMALVAAAALVVQILPSIRSMAAFLFPRTGLSSPVPVPRSYLSAVAPQILRTWSVCQKFVCSLRLGSGRDRAAHNLHVRSSGLVQHPQPNPGRLDHLLATATPQCLFRPI